MLKLLLATFSILYVSGALAQALPKVLQHSENRIVARKGDRVQLEIVAEKSSQDSEVQWWKGDELVCKKDAVCLVDTEEFEPGAQNIIAVLLNEAGSQFVSFQIVVKESSTSEAQTIVPSLVRNLFEPVKFDKNRPAIYALDGTGFSWRSDKVDVLRRVAKNVDWDEKVKASGATLHLNTPKKESVYFLPGSSGRLLKIDGKKSRIIYLKSGRLRQRSLNLTGTSDLSVVVGDFMQVDHSAGADYGVWYQKDKGTVILQMYSGHARVLLKETPDKSAKNLTLAAGMQYQFYEKAKKPIKEKSIAEKIALSFISKTTPKVLKLEKSLKPLEIVGVDWQNPVRASIDYQKRGLHTIVLATLARSQFGRDTASWKRLAGTSLQAIGLYEASSRFLKASFDQSPSSDTAFLIGLSYFERKKWEEAKNWYETALTPENFSYRGLCLYYLGVIKYHEKNFGAARDLFKEAKWYLKEKRLLVSIEEFLRTTKGVEVWSVSGGLFLNYDDNFLRVRRSSDLEFIDGVSNKGAAGYEGAINLWYRPIRLGLLDTKISYDLKRAGFLKKSLHRLDFIDQSVAISAAVGERYQIEAFAKLQTLIIGNERALDVAGGGIVLSAEPWWFEPSLHFEVLTGKDPLPDRNDWYDPVDFIPQRSASDRSSSFAIAKLGLTLYRQAGHEFGLLVQQRERSFANELVRTQDYSELLLGLSYELRFPGLSRAVAKGQHFRREFLGREERRSILDLSYLYDLSASQSFLISVLQEDNTDTQETFSYNRILYKVGMSLSL